MLNEAERMRASSLISRFAWATIALGLFAGIAGGAALGAWAVARRTSTVYDRFVAYYGASDSNFFACPDGVTFETPDAEERCRTYDYADILEFLADAPGVESVGRVTLALAAIAPADSPNEWERGLFPVPIDVGAIPSLGRPIVVAGRLADPLVATEVTINEAMSKDQDVQVGDELRVTPYRLEEFDAAGEGIEPPSGVPMTATVVGVTRRPADLAGRLDDGSYEDAASVSLTPAWFDFIDGDVARYGISMQVETDGSISHDQLIESIRERWPDRILEVESGEVSADGDQSTVVEAIRLQAVGLEIVAAILALAALVFAGQAIARETRREWSDWTVLSALGMTRPRMICAAVVRSGVTAAIAVIVAGVVAVALSPFGPIGIGRAAEPSRGVSVDWFVLAVGLPVVAAALIAATVVPVATLRRGESSVSAGSTSRATSMMPPTGVAGLAMTASRRAGGLALGSAVVGVALAAAFGVAAWSLMSSYDGLSNSPERYGASWDALVGNVGSDSQAANTRERLTTIAGVSSVGVKSETVSAANDPYTIVSFEPFVGDVNASVVLSGRPPASDEEVALGALTMRDFDVEIGDTVRLPLPNGEVMDPVEVVGVAVINDGLSARPGRGALITNDLFDRVIDGARSQSYAVFIDAAVDRTATMNLVREAFPTSLVEPKAPQQILNLGLVSRQPVLLAIIIGLLAGFAMVHALVMSVRRERQQIGVLKSLGFTRRQVMATTGWHATLITVLALVVGIPLGVLLGRVTWRWIVDDLGVASNPVLPVGAIVAVVLLTLAVANLAALGPGLSAARTRPAVALRTE